MARTYVVVGIAALPAIIAGIASITGNVGAIASVTALLVSTVTLFIVQLGSQPLAGGLGRLAFTGGVLLWFAYPAFMVTIVSRNFAMFDWPSFLTERHVVHATLLVSLFLSAGTVAAEMTSARNGRAHSVLRPVRSRALQVLLLLGAVGGLVPYFLLGDGIQGVLSGVMQSRAAEKAWLSTSNLGDSVSAFLTLAAAAAVGAGTLLCVSVFDLRISAVTRLFATGVGTLLTGIVYVDRGTRSLFALMALPVCFVAFRRAAIRSRTRALALGSSLAVLLVAAVQFQLLYRAEWTRDQATSSSERLLTLDGTIDFFSETVYAVWLVPGVHAYFHESALLHFFINPLPRFLWPGKPLPELVRTYSWHRWGVDIYEVGGNTLPGIVGQHYMSWGWPGVLAVGFTLGWLAARVDRFVFARRLTIDVYGMGLYAMFAAWVLVSFRFLAPNFVYPLLFAGVCVMFARQEPRRRLDRSNSEV